MFAAERELIFHAGWFYACHADSLPAGHRRVVDVAGESVIVARDIDGTLHAHANVCRHRGSQLCDAVPRRRAVKGAIRCPYHAWTYGLDGSLRATPRVDDELDRLGARPLARATSREWNGMIFVSVAQQPVALAEWLRDHTPMAARRSTSSRIDVARGRRPHASDRPGQLEDPDRELPGVPALRGRAPRAGRPAPDLPHRQRASTPTAPTAASSSIDGGDSFTARRHVEALAAARHQRRARQPLPRRARVPERAARRHRHLGVADGAVPDRPDSTTVVVAEYLFAADDVGRADFDPDADRRLQRARRAARTTRCASVSSAVSRREAFTHRRAHRQGQLVVSSIARPHYFPRHRDRQPGGAHMTSSRFESSRRDFIRESAQLAAMLGVGTPLLQACGGDDDDGRTAPSGTTARARHHHRRPGGSAPSPTVEATGREVTETDRRRPGARGAARSAIFNYADYVNPEVVAAFEAKYGVKVEITTFDVDSETITEARHRGGQGRSQPLDGAPTSSTG